MAITIPVSVQFNRLKLLTSGFCDKYLQGIEKNVGKADVVFLSVNWIIQTQVCVHIVTLDGYIQVGMSSEGLYSVTLHIPP